MPRMQTELTPEREAEAARRVARSRAAVAALPPRAAREVSRPTRRAAETAASRCGCPNTEVAAEQTAEGWVGVVVLRPDQLWMSASVRERGCRVRVSA